MPINTVIDGDVVFGSLAITISAQVYETDDFNIDFDINRFLRTNSKNIATGRVTQVIERTGTATFQFPSSAVVSPKAGDSFTVTIDTIALTCTITKCGLKRVKAGEAKMPCSFDVNIGTVTTAPN